MLSHCCHPLLGRDGPILLALRAWSTAEEVCLEMSLLDPAAEPLTMGQDPFTMSMHGSSQAEPLVHALQESPMC